MLKELMGTNQIKDCLASLLENPELALPTVQGITFAIQQMESAGWVVCYSYAEFLCFVVSSNRTTHPRILVGAATSSVSSSIK